MRDGNDEDGRIRPAGKILYSGIQPQDLEEIQPADYALEAGTPPLMGEPPYTRLQVLLMIAATAFVCGFLGSAMSAVFACAPGSAKSQRGEQLWSTGVSQHQEIWLAGARSMARGELRALVNSHDTFLRVIELHGGDEALWGGVDRLATFALLDKSDQASRVAQRILQVFEFRTPPIALRVLVPDLRSIAN